MAKVYVQEFHENDLGYYDGLPPEIFKYRTWTDDYHKKILNDCEIFFPSPSLFNDPLDCGLPFRQDDRDLDPIAIKEKLEELAPGQFPHLAHDPPLLQEQCAKQLLLIQQDPREYFQKNYGYRPEDLSKTFGVLSLTPHPNKFLMWSHYSNSHKGFVVGFDTAKLFKQVGGHMQKVNYMEEIPIISMFFKNYEHEIMEKLIYSKGKVWDYEDEFRISRIHCPNLKEHFTPDVLKSIYLGNKMPFNQKGEILEIVKGKFPHVIVYDMTLSNTKFELIPMRIF